MIVEKIAIVTGAASGIGFATAQRLLENAWNVALVDRDPEMLARSVQALATYSHRFSHHVADIVDEAAISQTVDEVGKRGPIRGVVNCAAIVAVVPLEETSVELFRRILEVNVIGSFIVARAAISHMRASGGGSIVNISSAAGVRGIMGRTAYGASKGGVISMTKVWATELAASGIRVNAIAPGPVETPMVRAAHTAEQRAAFIAGVPLHRYAQPAEIAAAICFLLSDEASYITGHVLAVDGGFTESLALGPR